MNPRCHVARSAVILGLGFLAACASIHSDRFYGLQPLPLNTSASHGPFPTQVSLRVTVPSMVDRNEMVFKLAGEVKILEHERWASPLADQINTVLGQDLELRRSDLLISNRRGSQTSPPRFNVYIDMIDVALLVDGRTNVEVRWRIESADGASSSVGRETFSAVPGKTGGYERNAHGLSQCVAELADRLIQSLPAAGA